MGMYAKKYNFDLPISSPGRLDIDTVTGPDRHDTHLTHEKLRVSHIEQAKTEDLVATRRTRVSEVSIMSIGTGDSVNIQYAHVTKNEE